MRALVLVDIQNDFMPFGSLPVAEGDQVVRIANAVAPRFKYVTATQDWHPQDHSSFASNHPGYSPGDVITLHGQEQVLWPDHCVQNMPGASFHSALDVSLVDAVIHKGTDADIDSYSTFFDNGHRKDTGLARLLRDRGVEEVWLLGLATDYCVLWSALDALELGFRVVVMEDGVRAVNLKPGDGTEALEQMRAVGARITTSAEVLG